jgi:eukaryotic-like serine/threonine-protein kinase
VLTPFGHYLLDEEIARGGMARVFRARLRGPGGFEKTLVVKQVRPELARDPRFVRMFVEEAKTLVQMSHPHVVAVYELGVVEGVYFLAMEHVEGVTLAQLLREGPLAPALAAHVGAQVCDALAYAHERFGLMHRDVTPRNIMVEPTGHVRLLDFGIAAPTEGAGGGEVFGSPGYMSPEQAQGLPLDERTDLFSFGAVLYECLTGRRAFEGRTSQETRDALLQGPPAPLTDEYAPPELTTVLTALLSPDPEDRPASATEVGRHLRTWLAHHAPQGVAPELGLRAEQARQAMQGEGAGPSDGEGFTPSSDDAPVETLATSTALSEWLGTGAPAEAEDDPGTVPIPGRKRPSASQAPRHEPTFSRRASAAWIAITGAILTASTVAPWFMNVDRTGAEAPPADGTSVDAPEGDPAPAPTPVASPVPEEAPAEPAPPSPDAQAAPAPPQRAHLTVSAVPWAEVHLDGRSLGTTPLRGHRIPPGSHRLTLACPPLGHSAQVSIDPTAGASVRVLADLTTDPPTIRVE